MKYIGVIPNMLTVSRIGITMLLDLMIIIGFESGSYVSQIAIITVLTLILYGTDFLDGRLARAWKCSSKFGARADIVADFFYIISQDLILVYYNRMNRWIIILILLEFALFIASSMKVTKLTGMQQIWFDRIGRATAVYYYAMPFTYWLFAGAGNQTLYAGIVTVADFICVILTVLAIGSRLTVLNAKLIKA